MPWTPALFKKEMEATSGFEPLDKGFADLCLTTWLRRLISDNKKPESNHEKLLDFS
jgi:hypothetical protein